ncbi:DUF6634 family protein [Bradyrhizobium sp. AZCC 2289]|uniref:DUF6634 family protein n=1 Tax=Bradyrhizobium sp. AZCC 2289 TaxID=3117026 RepID=UPI00302B85AD
MAVVTNCGGLDALQEQLIGLLNDIREIREQKAPSAADLKAIPLLDQWSLGLVSAPCIVGTAVGHPNLGNRARIHTTQMVLMDWESGWARTWSRYYRLGAPERPPTGSGSFVTPVGEWPVSAPSSGAQECLLCN